MKFGFGKCHCCLSSYLGYAPGTIPLDNGIGNILGTDELRQQSLDRASLPGHDVVVATDNARNYKLPAGGRWSSKVVIPTKGALCNFFGMIPPLGVDVDIKYVWAPAEAMGEDIFGLSSLILHIEGTMEGGQLNVSLSSDWDDAGYPFGIGTMRVDNQSFLYIRYFGILKDSIQGMEPYAAGFDQIIGTELQTATLHRPIKSNIPRRLHIINGMEVDWYFDGLSINGVTDDRTPDRDATGSCPTVFVENRNTINNEPFAINAELDGLQAIGTHLSLRRTNDMLVDGVPFVDGIRWIGRSLAVRKSNRGELPELPPIPLGTEVDQIAWLDVIDPDVLFRVEFGPTEILTLDETGKPATVLCQCNLRIYQDIWLPVSVDYMNDWIGVINVNTQISQVDMTFVLPAWDRGQLPTITIEPGATPGTIVVNSVEGTSTEWIAPRMITARKFVWDGTQWLPQGVEWDMQDDEDNFEGTAINRVLIIRNQSLA